MSGLSTLQGDFARGVLADDRSILGRLADDGRQDERFSVYRNNTFASIRAVLADAFPTVQAIVGEALFARLSGAYVRHEPPAANHLLDYGASLAGFIAVSEPTAPWPWLADVARLDWARNAAYMAADADALSAADLAGMDVAALLDLRPGLIPSAVLLRADWPIHAIWMNPGIAAAAGGLQPRSEHVLVARPAMQVETLPLAPAEHAMLVAIAAGHSLGDAAALAQDADPAFDLMGAIARHLAAGLFGRPDTSPETTGPRP